MPEFPVGLDPFQHSRKEMADFAVRARDLGVNFIGACCGAVATHIREMSRALGKASADSRPWSVDYKRPMSAFEYYKHEK
jgi:betaine-homocysteine S-methyltransferase